MNANGRYHGRAWTLPRLRNAEAARVGVGLSGDCGTPKRPTEWPHYLETRQAEQT
jgi:hypothetical protein